MRGRTNRTRGAWIAMVAALVLGALPAHAASRLDAMGGHLGFGFTKLFIEDGPAGSLSMAGGIDVPVTSTVRVGVDLGFHLLGTRTVERDSLLAAVDYSLFEVIAFAHWSPPALAPLGRISVGPALLRPKGDLSTSGGIGSFRDLAVSEAAPGVAFEAVVMRRTPSPVRIGFAVGGRIGFLDEETWTLGMVQVRAYY